MNGSGGPMVVVAVTLGWVSLAFCQPTVQSRSAALLARALTYDQNLKQRAGDGVVLAVIFEQADSGSQKEGQEVARAFRALEDFKLQGLRLRTVAAAFSGISALEALVKKEGASALYLCRGLDGNLLAITQLTRRRKIVSMGGREDLVKRGVSLAVEIDENPAILVNLKASREEGVAFGSDLLRHARMVE